MPAVHIRVFRKKTQRVGQLQPHQRVLGSMSMGLPALCKGEALLAAFLPCLLPLLWGAQQSANSSSVFWHCAAAVGMERVGTQQAPGPTRGCLFLPELYWAETFSSVGHTVVGPVPVLGKGQLFPVWSRVYFRSCLLFLGGLLLYMQK